MLFFGAGEDGAGGRTGRTPKEPEDPLMLKWFVVGFGFPGCNAATKDMQVRNPSASNNAGTLRVISSSSLYVMG